MKIAIKTVLVGSAVAIGLFAMYLPFRNTAHAQAPPPPHCIPNMQQMDWLSFEKSLDFLRQYRKNQLTGINSKMSDSINTFQDTRSIVFTLKDLRAFIDNIEAMTIAGQIKNSDNYQIQSSALGVRFYYAAYTPGYPKHPLKHTLIMVPVYKDTMTKQYVEFFPWFANGARRPLLLEEYKRNPLEVANFVEPPNIPKEYFKNMLLTPQFVETHVKNEGTLCPPPTGCNQTLEKMSQ